MVSKRPCSVVDIIKFAQRYWKQILKLQKFYQISQTRTIISVQRLANVNRCTNLFTIQTKTIRFNGNWARQFIDHRVIGYSANASSVFTPFVMFFSTIFVWSILEKRLVCISAYDLCMLKMKIVICGSRWLLALSRLCSLRIYFCPLKGAKIYILYRIDAIRLVIW